MQDESNSIESVEAREPRRLTVPVEQARDEQHHLDEDAAFMLGLRMKLENADWSKYERGSEAFFDIDTDLEKLTKSNPEAAAQLWRTSSPPGTKFPHYLDAALERLQNQQASRAPSALEDPRYREQLQVLKDVTAALNGEPSSPARLSTDPKPGGGEAEKDEFKLPASIAKRYIQAEGKFHFRDAQNKLAFEDHGRKMQTEHNSPDIAASMVELAKAKGWTQLKVRGTEDFKREVWLQASLRGIEVSGYKPKDVDLAKLDEMKAARGNTVERAAGRAPRPLGDREQPRPVSHQQQPAKHGVDQDKARDAGLAEQVSLTGRLVAHGEAHFDFDAKNEKSYFVKVETPNGTRIHWGNDLRKAMDASGTRTGDDVTLEKAPSKGKSDPTWSVSIAATKQPELKPEQKVVIGVLSEVLKEKRYSEKTIAGAVEEATQRLHAMERNGKAAPAVKVFDRKAPRLVERPKVVSKSREQDLQRTR